jgi:predicted TIM-barrel fold metal-dependent hydrolase
MMTCKKYFRPRNGKLGDLLDNAAWQAGYAELASVGFSFDLQLNPPQ